MNRAVSLIFMLLVCYAIAGIGAQATVPGLPWLETLRKPPFNPPAFVFGPVWAVLYTLIAISGWLTLGVDSDVSGRFTALWIFALQLAFNLLWAFLFFYLRQPGWALVDIVLLLTTIWSYVIVVSPVNVVSAWLFVPYGLWVAFATVLNASFWWLNRSGGSG